MESKFKPKKLKKVVFHKGCVYLISDAYRHSN